MNYGKALSLILLCASFALASCSGPFNGGNKRGGTANVTFTLVADTLPANPSIFSFKVSVNSIQITPTTGSALTLTPATPIVDLMRLQSDTAFLGMLASVPAGTYTIKVSLATPASGSTIVFFNDTGSNITNANPNPCVPNAVCTATLTASGSPSISSFTFQAIANSTQGIELDFNLKNAISISGSTLTVNLNPTSPMLAAFILPRQNANLASNQVELLEDFTGVVSLNGNNVTVTSPKRGTLTATNTSSSFFDASPDGTICPTPSTFSCVKSGQVASVDAFLNSDGTISLKEFEPLVATQKDLVEGTVYSISSPTQFGLVVTDKTQAASGSLIGGLNTGDLLTVNLSTSASGFFVDTKGLLVSNFSSFTNFSGQTSTSAMHAGQSIAVHVTTFTAASGTTLASANVDTVTLRWSRLIGGVFSSSTNLVNVNPIPSYFALTSGSGFPTQVFFNGSPGGDGITNLDGITDAASLKSSLPVAIRALYLQSTTNSANPVFFAAKVRQH